MAQARDLAVPVGLPDAGGAAVHQLAQAQAVGQGRAADARRGLDRVAGAGHGEQAAQLSVRAPGLVEDEARAVHLLGQAGHLGQHDLVVGLGDPVIDMAAGDDARAHGHDRPEAQPKEKEGR